MLSNILKYDVKDWSNAGDKVKAGRMGRDVEARQDLGEHSLWTVSLFLEICNFALLSFPMAVYSELLYKPFQKLHFVISKLLKTCLVSYFGSATLCTKEGYIVI